MSPTTQRTILSTYLPFDRSAVAPLSYFALQQQLLTIICMGEGLGVGLFMRNMGCALELRKDSQKYGRSSQELLTAQWMGGELCLALSEFPSGQ